MIDYGYGKIRLGTIDSDDLHQFWLDRNKAEIRDNCRQVGLITFQEQDAWYNGLKNDPKRKIYSVMAPGKYTLTTIGCAGLTDINLTHRTAEYSLFISPNKQGEGHGTSALKTLIRHGFEDLNLNCIWGEIFEHNAASINIAVDKLGFVTEGHHLDRYYKNGKYINTYTVSLLKKDWKAW